MLAELVFSRLYIELMDLVLAYCISTFGVTSNLSHALTVNYGSPILNLLPTPMGMGTNNSYLFVQLQS